MTWTYDLALTAAKDRVRFELGDTDPSAPLVTDEEIAYALTVERNYLSAAARCAESVSRNFARKADVRIGRGGTTLTYSTAAKQYLDMAAALRKRANATVAPWSGGRSIDDKIALAQDASLVQPIFTKHMQSNPLVGGQGNDDLTDQAQSENQ